MKLFEFRPRGWGARALPFACLIMTALTSDPAVAQGVTPILPGGTAKGPVNISAPSLDYLDKEHKLIYSGGVVARQGDSTLRASMLTIFLNDGPGPASDTGAGSAKTASGNQIRRIEAAGPVTMTSKSQVGTGDSGVYDRASNTLTLNGNVTLSQCANVLKGAKLVYDLTTGRAQVSGGVTSLFTPGMNCDAPNPKVAPGPVKPKPAAPPNSRQPPA